MSLTSYNCIITGPLANYVRLSVEVGEEVGAQAKQVEEAFQAQNVFLMYASTHWAPAGQNELVELLKPTSVVIQDIQKNREKMRSTPMFNHLSTVSESIPALGWVTVGSAPAPFIKEMIDAGQFYSNRVLKDFKGVNKVHVDWVKAWSQTLTELQLFVKEFHTTGLEWERKSCGAPPPPPALPPPPPTMPPGDAEPLDNASDRAALFAELNRGEGITASLKKVTPEMQTHKNPTMRSGPAPFKVSSQTSPVTKSVSAPKSIDKPSVFKQDGKKWLVENHKGNHTLVIEGAEMSHQVYMFNCHDSTLIIKGKLNTVIIDSCQKTAVVFDSLVSSMEFVNCQSVQMQVFNKVPTISIDKTDGCQIYLSPTSLDVSIITSKSSAMNVLLPKDDGDFIEHAIPEQFKTTVNLKGLTTVPLDSLG